MRPIIPFIFLVPVVFLGCREEVSGPEEEDDDHRPITEASVGASGGMLRTEDFCLNVPPGAFSGSEELELVAQADSGLFGENSRSIPYRIEGLPETYDIPLRVSIAYEGSLSGETFVVVGEEAIDPQSGVKTVIYDFLAAEDSSGFLVCEIPGLDAEQTAKTIRKGKPEAGEKKWISVEAVSDYFSTYFDLGEEAKYKIYIPAGVEDLYSPMLHDYLDNAYTRINHELLEDLDSKYIITYPVFMANLAGDDCCRFAWRNGSSDGRKKAKGILAVNVNKFNEDPDRMQIMIGREVLRSLLFVYDPEYPRMRPPDQVPHHWLDQAVLSWSETEFADELDRADLIPSDFRGNELAPFNGMHAGILMGNGTVIENITGHGRGMSAFIKFLSDNFSHIWFPGIYMKISEGVHPVEAIRFFLEAVHEGSKDYDWWNDWIMFYMDYLKGECFAVPGSTFMERIPEAQKFSVNSKDDTLKTFQGSYPDLSGKLYAIEVNDQDIRENGTLECSLTEGGPGAADAGIILFGYNGDKITPLNEDLSPVATGLQAYKSVLALVFNSAANQPYTGSSSVEWQVKVFYDRSLPYVSCKIETRFWGPWEHDWIPPVNPEPFIDTLLWAATWYTRGGCSGNTYIGTINPEMQGVGATGEARVTLDDDLNVTSFEVVAYWSPQDDSITWSIRGDYTAKTYEIASNLQHEVSGSAVCQSVSGVYYYSEGPTSTPGTRRYSKMTGFLCNEESYLKLSFSTY
jgi:hypothetical protein